MTDTAHPVRPTGLILAGGQSRRMRDALPLTQPDKSLAGLAGRPLLSHVLQRFAPQVGPIVLNANGDSARFSAFDLPVVADRTADFAGPLAGLLAGLQWSRAHAPHATHIASVSTDVPFIPTDLVAKLQDAIAGAHAPIAIARSRSGLHPVIGLWPVALMDDLDAALRTGTRKVQDWTTRHGAIPVDFPDILVKGRAVDPFFNTNTPHDLAEARARLEVPPIIGIAGWKNSGKTTLTVRLVETFTSRGLKVATIKRTHHNVAGESETSDTARHRRAGASTVILVSAERWGPLHALREAPEPSLDEILASLIGGTDLVIVEGWKSAAIAKIEVRRADQLDRRPLAPGDADIIAIASDHDDHHGNLPIFAINDTTAIANFIAHQLDLKRVSD